MSIFSKIGDWISGFEAPAEAWAAKVAHALVTWAEEEAILVEDDLKVAETALLPIWQSIGPGQWMILQGLVATAEADVKNGDYGDLVTDVLNQAAAKELAWVSALGTRTLTVILAALHLSAPARVAP